MAKLSTKEVLDKFTELWMNQAENDKELSEKISKFSARLLVLEKMIEECKDGYKSKIFNIVYLLIIALCAIIGVKVVMP